MNILYTIFFPLLVCLGTDKMENEHIHPDWVHEIMDKEPQFTQITECVYGGTLVWKVNSCVTCNDMITKVYDEQKNLVCQYGGVLRQNTCSEQDIILEDCRVIYKPKVGVTIGF